MTNIYVFTWEMRTFKLKTKVTFGNHLVMVAINHCYIHVRTCKNKIHVVRYVYKMTISECFLSLVCGKKRIDNISEATTI